MIWLVAHAFLRQGDRALIVGPTFGEYERAARAVGAEVIEFRSSPPDFLVDVDRLVCEIETRHPKVVFLCNPNNPTGGYLSESEVNRLAEACGDGLLILDEAYRGFVTLSPFGSIPRMNVVVLRSMTKDFALAGLRLGYVLAEPKLITAMRACQPPWSVSSMAQAAGLAGLGDLDHLQRTLELTHQLASALQRALTDLGARVAASRTHFCLIEVGDGAHWRKRLLSHGCVARDCASFGLPQYVRIGTRQPAENETLIRAWERNRLPPGVFSTLFTEV